MVCLPLLQEKMIMRRTREEWSFGGLYSLYSYRRHGQLTHLAPRKLDGVIKKLEPLSEEHTLLKFLRNVDNAKILSGFVQELADAVEYYQV
jgi:hypothetical protein